MLHRVVFSDCQKCKYCTPCTTRPIPCPYPNSKQLYGCLGGCELINGRCVAIRRGREICGRKCPYCLVDPCDNCRKDQICMRINFRRLLYSDKLFSGKRDCDCKCLSKCVPKPTPKPTPRPTRRPTPTKRPTPRPVRKCCDPLKEPGKFGNGY